MENNNDENDNDDRLDTEEERYGLSVTETVKKLFSAGVSAAFMTEESIRSLVGDIKLPKESLNLLLQGATKSKEELMNRVGNEMIKVIQRIDFVKEASRFVEEHKFRINAEIEVIRREKPDARVEENEIQTKIQFEKKKS